MRSLLSALIPLLALPLLLAGRAQAEPPFSFRVQEIDNSLKIGYAVLVVDVNGDRKPDLVVVDTNRIHWYENPTWKRRTILEGMTKPDNVCLSAHDIDGDGQVDFAIGCGWGNLSSKIPGPIVWARRGKTLDEPWQVFPISEENSVHRIRFADLDGQGKPALVVAPLLGKNSTAARNFMDGAPVRLLAFRIPKDPTRDRWVPEVLDDTIHVMHNFWAIPAASGKGADILTASYEGVRRLQRGTDGKWIATQLGTGNQDNPKSNRGASEIKLGHLGKNHPFVATIEPWHGNQVVVYTPPTDSTQKLWTRHMLDDRLKWGHGVWCADLDGDGRDELIIGVRDNLSQKPGEKCGLRIYKATDERGSKWQRTLVDEGGVAIEDLTAADLDGDGTIDIIAVGRQTKNLRIYWNGKK